MRGPPAVLLFSTLWALSATAEETGPRVAVIAVGQDALLGGGTLQQWTENALARESAAGAVFILVPSSAVGARLAAGGPPPPAGEEPRIAALLEKVKDAYFDEKLVDALETLTHASRLIDAGLGGPRTDRVTVLTWRTALFLAMKNTAQAEAEARLLLTLAPDAVPDLDIFRPSVQQLVNATRAKMPKPVDVKLEGAPPGARIEMDGRRVETRFRVGIGEHRVSLRAPGFRPVSVGFDAQSDLVVGVTPMLDLSPSQLAIVTGAIWENGKATDLEELTGELGVDALLVVSARTSELRAALGRPKGDLRRSEPVSAELSGVAEIARWTVTELASIKPAPAPSTTLLSLACEVPGAAVFIDSLPIAARTPILRPLPVAIGKVKVRIEAAGYEDFVTTVETRAGVTASLKAVLKRKPQPIAVKPTPGAKRPITRNPLFWGAVGAGIAVIAGAAAIAASQAGGGDGKTTYDDKNSTVPPGTTITW